MERYEHPDDCTCLRCSGDYNTVREILYEIKPYTLMNPHDEDREWFNCISMELVARRDLDRDELRMLLWQYHATTIKQFGRCYKYLPEAIMQLAFNG